MRFFFKVGIRFYFENLKRTIEIIILIYLKYFYLNYHSFARYEDSLSNCYGDRILQKTTIVFNVFEHPVHFPIHYLTVFNVFLVPKFTTNSQMPKLFNNI